jgi:uncharacterized membrane protein YeaQ/YmgE (transglycosylase-associated protein family)
MKVVRLFALVGATLGAIIAVLVHFLSQTLPGTYDVAGVRNAQTGTQTLLSPLVHPSWFPMLPSAIAIGAVVGAVVALMALRAGYTIIRRTR